MNDYCHKLDKYHPSCLRKSFGTPTIHFGVHPINNILENIFFGVAKENWKAKVCRIGRVKGIR
jgi:hypothetical protein